MKHGWRWLPAAALMVLLIGCAQKQDIRLTRKIMDLYGKGEIGQTLAAIDEYKKLPDRSPVIDLEIEGIQADCYLTRGVRLDSLHNAGDPVWLNRADSIYTALYAKTGDIRFLKNLILTESRLGNHATVKDLVEKHRAALQDNASVMHDYISARIALKDTTHLLDDIEASPMYADEKNFLRIDYYKSLGDRADVEAIIKTMMQDQKEEFFPHSLYAKYLHEVGDDTSAYKQIGIAFKKSRDKYGTVNSFTLYGIRAAIEYSLGKKEEANQDSLKYFQLRRQQIGG